MNLLSTLILLKLLSSASPNPSIPVCRITNHLYVCQTTSNNLESVSFEDANAVQTIDDVEVHMESFNITDTSERSFNEVRNSTALYMSDNRLRVIRKYYFHALDQLTYLDLKNNDINEIEDGAFARLSSLETLLLDGNHITRLGPTVWKGLTSLRELYATNNSIVLRKNMFRGLRQLETLALDANDIEELPVGSFNGLPHMDLLYLSRNDISMVHQDVFRGLTELNELDLSRNRIVIVPGGLFRNMRSLDSLWLNANRIASLQAGCFDGLDGLKFLFLSGNELETVDMSIFGVMRKVSIEPGFIIDGSLRGNLTVVKGIVRCESTGSEEPYNCVFKGYRQTEVSKPHPCYRSTSMDYGWYTPTIHTVPTTFYPRNTSFSNELNRGGMYRNCSLNTELDKTFF